MKLKTLLINPPQIFTKNQLVKQSKILDCISLCTKFNTMSKIHNADYLTDNSIKLHKKIGVHGMNIAPEFGVTETIAFLRLLDENKDKMAKDVFGNDNHGEIQGGQMDPRQVSLSPEV